MIHALRDFVADLFRAVGLLFGAFAQLFLTLSSEARGVRVFVEGTEREVLR